MKTLSEWAISRFDLTRTIVATRRKATLINHHRVSNRNEKSDRSPSPRNPKRPQTVDGMKNLPRAIAASISSCHVFVDVILHSDADSIIHISTTR